jgi:hypothetical protein
MASLPTLGISLNILVVAQRVIRSAASEANTATSTERRRNETSVMRTDKYRSSFVERAEVGVFTLTLLGEGVIGLHFFFI